MTHTLRHLRIAAALTGALALQACGESWFGLNGDLPYLQTPESVAVSHAIPVVLRNPTDREFLRGACSFAVERMVDDTWQEVWPAPQTVCAAVGIGVGPGSVDEVQLPGVVEAGTYRVTLDLMESYSDRRHLLVSSSFIVE